jgi:long-chain acyl-CoA synthetase
MPKAKNGDYESIADEPYQVQAFPPLTVLLNPFAWLLWLLDLIVWLICIPCCGPCKSFIYWIKRCGSLDSYPDPEGYEEDETYRRRSKDEWSEGLMEVPYPDEDDPPTTVWEIIDRSLYVHADKNAFGTRMYLGKTDDKPYPKAIFGETEWTDYQTAGEQMKAFGAGLRCLGLQPQTPGMDLEKTAGPHTMLIFEDTCQQWLTALAGAHSQSICVATSYATLGIQAVAEAIAECNITAVVCNRKNVDEVAKVAPQVLQTIIYTNHQVDPTTANKPLTVNSPRVRAISFEEVLSLGEANINKYPPTPPSPDNLAVIMYTSGSTGKPKGVMIPHRSVAASASAMQTSLNLNEGSETYLAYLPAAHIFEFCAEIMMMMVGAEIGFSDTKTITSKGAVRQREDGTMNYSPAWPDPPGGVQEFRPTLMVAVPIVWDSFKKTIEEGIGAKSCLVGWLFQVAYSGTYYARHQGRTTPVLNLLYKSIQGLVGGRLKLGVSGGGPISKDVQEFMSICAGMPLIQGYALTETCCAGTIQKLGDPDPGCVGGPVGSVEMKLRSCDGNEDPADPEGYAYLSTDEWHLDNPCLGRGEVCIRGPSVSKGYFNQPDKTREAWDGPPGEEGWFRTGDIAYWDTRGRLRIVDRLKNLIKLKGGEYIAVENMEKEYGTSPYVRGGVSGGLMCYGDGDLRRPVALVQANMPELKKLGLGDMSDEALCQSKEAQKAVLNSLNSAGKGKLGNNESLVAIRLISGTGPESGTPSESSPWTPENGCKTASNKLDRKAIQKAHEGLMAELKKEGA